MTIVSAQEATRSVWCAAEACGNEAESGSRLCWRCAKRDSVRIHVAPSIDTSPSLRCSTCGEFKADDAFFLQRATKMRARRNRNSECKQCCNQRRNDRFTKRRCAAYSPKHDRQCKGYAQADSPYCNLHRP